MTVTSEEVGRINQLEESLALALTELKEWVDGSGDLHSYQVIEACEKTLHTGTTVSNAWPMRADSTCH